MKDNYILSLHGNLVQLVPYRKLFVQRYHEWMQSEELLILTASEPLSIEEEYEMQLSWKNDPKKCTFIVLTTNKDGSDRVGKYQDSHHDVQCMIGDVNLFLNKDDEGNRVAEIDIMIAEHEFRRSGCGREAVKLMIWYAKHIGITKLFAKINEVNSASIRLFQR
jgi:RimJ/RimL family protein N-acetyltransferase